MIHQKKWKGKQNTGSFSSFISHRPSTIKAGEMREEREGIVPGGLCRLRVVLFRAPALPA